MNSDGSLLWVSATSYAMSTELSSFNLVITAGNNVALSFLVTSFSPLDN